MAYRLGVDVGGTFTDLVLVEEQTGESIVAKVPSTPKSPDEGVLNGIRKVMSEAKLKISDITFLIHGTTVATNALIERKGANVALLVTRGFRDVLHIGRQTRPKLYDFRAQRPEPLIPRQSRFELPERITWQGQVIEKLDEGEVEAVAKQIAEKGIDIVVVCLINSYANPSHEERVKEILKKELPDVYVSISTEIIPEFKEYERMSTAVINAYVMPIIERYLKRIRNELDSMGIKPDLHIMQSNGGVMTSETASKMSVHTVLSGPAAGALGGVMLGKMIGCDNIINVDMGGTSFDVSLAYKGALNFTAESEIAGYITRVPMIDIKTLGAGGGSIAWIDAGGALQVGPQSAGAVPGPVCYSRGGIEPTVSDADVVLGYLNPEYITGGEMKLDVEAARDVIKQKIAKPLNLSIEEAAVGIVKVVNATMVKGLRIVSVEQGYDPRQFSLMCFGGAGPVHAVMLAKELDIPKIIVPNSPGLLCALGLLMADFRHDFVQTFIHQMSCLDLDNFNGGFKELEQKAVERMVHEGIPKKDIVLKRAADMRYVGQGYTLEVDMPGGKISKVKTGKITESFHQAHIDSYGYDMCDHDIEFVNLRIVALGMLSKPDFEKKRLGKSDASGAIKAKREVFMGKGFRKASIYERNLLKPGNKMAGPCIIEQLDSTTVVLPEYEVTVDAYGNLIITVQDN